jgi:hypothetical protein
LSGPAAEEASRPPEVNLALQAKMQSKGFLSSSTPPDGIFGSAVRTAVAAWQRASGRPETSFFSNSDTAVLVGSAAPVAPNPLDAFSSKPLAQASLGGETASVQYKGLRVTLAAETSKDPAICQPSGADFLLFGASGDIPCRAVVVRLQIDGKEVYAAPETTLSENDTVGRLDIEVALRNLDGVTDLPQVVLTGYTGGAHCCTATTVLTHGADGVWKAMPFSQIDGDTGFAFLQVAAGKPVLIADYGEGFLYRFASYAGSDAPTLLRQFNGTVLRDVTKDPDNRPILVADLKRMEGRPLGSEPNGALAAWVAQKAMLGQLADAWQTLLKGYDRKSTNGLSTCMVDEHLWVKASYGNAKICPPGQEKNDPFPQVLALFLVEHGYISAGESAGLGYDPEILHAQQAAARAAATERYENGLLNGWFTISRAGACQAAVPASPAALVEAHRLRGTEDDVSISSADADGKPQIVRVNEPRGGGLMSSTTFYRGQARCEAAAQARERSLDQLR